jgi:hypothetical protein
MSTSTSPEGGYRYEDEQGHGWVVFAGVLLLIIGVVNAIQGIAAIDQANFYVGNAHYVFGDLKTWGWVVLIIGLIQVLVGLGVFARNQLARWTGVVALGLNSIAQLLIMPAYPFWSLSIFALNTLAIYGLIVYGWRLER